MLLSFKDVVQKICQIARRALCSATAVVAAMEKKRRDSAFTKEQEIFIIKQFNCGLGPIEVRRAFRKQFGMSRHLQKGVPQCLWRRNVYGFSVAMSIDIATILTIDIVNISCNAQCLFRHYDKTTHRHCDN